MKSNWADYILQNSPPSFDLFPFHHQVVFDLCQSIKIKNKNKKKTCGSWQTFFSKNNGDCTGVVKKKKKKKKKTSPIPLVCIPGLDPTTTFAICFVCSSPLPSCISILVPVWKLTISYSGNIEKNYIDRAEVCEQWCRSGHGCFEGKRERERERERERDGGLGLERKKKFTAEVREQRR